jgi:alpha-L-fucosidase
MGPNRYGLEKPRDTGLAFNESPVAKYVVVNDRWGKNTKGKNTGSTYTTSEYGSGMNPDVIWEESRGIGHSYGYNRNEKLEDYKSSLDLILMLVDIVSRGGNLLLDIGPTADGRIPVIMQQRLTDIGNWLSVNGEQSMALPHGRSLINGVKASVRRRKIKAIWPAMTSMH